MGTTRGHQQSNQMMNMQALEAIEEMQKKMKSYRDDIMDLVR